MTFSAPVLDAPAAEALARLAAARASGRLFTLGPERITPEGLDLASCPMRLWRGDEEVSAGSGAACLGHPATAVGAANAKALAPHNVRAQPG